MLKRLHDLRYALAAYPKWNDIKLKYGDLTHRWNVMQYFSPLPLNMIRDYWSEILQADPNTPKATKDEVPLCRFINKVVVGPLVDKEQVVYIPTARESNAMKEKRKILSSFPNEAINYSMPVRNRVKSDNNMKIINGPIGKYGLYYERLGTVGSWLSSFPKIDEAYSDALKMLQPGTMGLYTININELENSHQLYDKTKNYGAQNILFGKPQEIKEAYVVASLGIYSHSPGTRLVISPITAYQYVPIYEEASLTVPYLNYKYIRINGVSFLSRDLRLLYNTFLFETLFFTNESDITFPTLKCSDLLLLKDMFTGMSPMLYVYEHLSDYAYNQLSGDRTMFALYDEVVVRIAIDKAYLPGTSLRDQFKQATIPEELGRVVRLDELIRIASE